MAFLHVFKATKCDKIIYTAERREVVEGIRKADAGMQAWEVPALWTVFDEKVEHYPYARAFADVEDEVPTIIHSSGTTGE